jgi:hypothetical protein
MTTACCRRWRIASISDSLSTKRPAIGAIDFRSPSNSKPVIIEPKRLASFWSPAPIDEAGQVLSQLALEFCDLSWLHNNRRSQLDRSRKK